MDTKNAPIVIFGFNRPDAMANLFASLEKNPELSQSDVFVYVDGPRNEAEKEKTNAVGEVARKYTPNVYLSEKNKGLGASIISGITEVINRYGSVIVIEDDLVLAPNFLAFMNEGLRRYKDKRNIISVCGYGLKIKRPKGYVADVYLSDRSSSWGWGTWADRWNKIDWYVKDWSTFSHDKSSQIAFNQAGSDMTSMLRDYMEGRNRSWAIRFCYSQFRQKLYSVHPFLSKVENEGFGADATNCNQRYSRFHTEFDNTSKREFVLPVTLRPDSDILHQLHSYHALWRRIYSRIRKILNV